MSDGRVVRFRDSSHVPFVWLGPALAMVACGSSGGGPVETGGLTQVTTLAGAPGVCAFADGTGSDARFNVPSGVAVAPAGGDIFVADFQNFRIRRVTPDGTVTTLAGGDASAGRCVDGPGDTAGFAYPSAIAADAAGNLYVYDHCAIRRIDPAGQVTTLAGALESDGTPDCGYVDDASGAVARFDDAGYGGGIASDAAGNVYVADFGNDAIRKVTADGAVTTLAGGAGAGYADGSGASARFDGPAGVAVAADGVVYVTEAGNNRLRVIAPGGSVTTLAGDGQAASKDGLGAGASFFVPWGVAMGADETLFVSESKGNVIRRVSRAGAVTTLAGDGFAGSKDGPLHQATFFSPGQVAMGPSGSLYVADQGSCLLRAITP